MPITYVENKEASKVNPKLKVVDQFIQEKQAIEVMLAWNLMETFNKEPLISTVREGCKKALNEMVGLCLTALASGDLKQLQAITHAVQDEQQANMSLLKLNLRTKEMQSKDPVLNGIVPGMPHKGFARIIENADKLDASDCSDVIRLYGTVVEKVAAEAPALMAAYKAILTKKMAERRGAEGSEAQEDVDKVWNTKTPKKGDKDFQTAAGRHRFRFEAKKGLPGPYQQAIEAAGPDSVQGFLVSQKGGQSIFGLADTSTIGKLDRVFGLVPAADISGTTADTIFFMKKFMSNVAATWDPIFFLLPTATIVGGAHHSLLEVALPLSAAKDTGIDYHIGFYGSLMPKGTNSAVAPTIKKILDEADLDKARKVAGAKPQSAGATIEFTNRHLLVTFEKEKVVSGAYVFDGPDVAKFKAHVKGTKMLADLKAMKPWPTKADVDATFKAILK